MLGKSYAFVYVLKNLSVLLVLGLHNFSKKFNKERGCGMREAPYIYHAILTMFGIAYILVTMIATTDNCNFLRK